MSIIEKNVSRFATSDISVVSSIVGLWDVTLQLAF